MQQRPVAATPERPVRADARRNRERILAAARELFAEGSRDVGMGDIAQRANVGVGTLYRNFGGRTGLSAALHLDDLDALIARAEKLCATQTAWSALEQWLKVYLDYCQQNREMLSELEHALRDAPELGARIAQRTTAAADHVVEHAQASGVVDPKLAGSDLIQMVCGMVIPPDDHAERNEYRLGIILNGIARQCR